MDFSSCGAGGSRKRSWPPPDDCTGTCLRPRGKDGVQPARSPESIARVFAEAWNNRDPDKLASLFDEDAEFVNVTGLWWHDRRAIRKAHAYGLEVIFKESALEVQSLRVKWLSDEIAVVHAKMRLPGQMPLAGVAMPGTRHNIFSFVVRRTPGGWRCASAHNTDIVPGAETNIVDDRGQLKSVNYRLDEPEE